MTKNDTDAALTAALARYRAAASAIDADQDSHNDAALVAEFDAAYAAVERLQDAMWEAK